jgi:hypothetical protein
VRIEDYGLIGDLQAAALVGRNGSVDWLCLPRFDSPSCFSALLGDETHGRWLVVPSGDVRSSSRRYRPGTLVLETEFETDEGAVRVIDFMPRSPARSWSPPCRGERRLRMGNVLACHIRAHRVRSCAIAPSESREAGVAVIKPPILRGPGEGAPYRGTETTHGDRLPLFRRLGARAPTSTMPWAQSSSA